jgi:aryl carrier-like protein
LAKSELSAVSVIVREDVPGDRHLVCYYTGGSAALGEAELRALVAGELPEYMIPARWVALERMPLTAAGKIDRAALPAPEKSLASSTFSAPATATESALAEIWANVLQLERVGRDDDFIALGGDSIQLFQITARANKNGLAIAARQLLKHRTIAALARELDENPQVPAAQNGAMPPFAFRKVRTAEPAEVPHEVSA